MIKKIICLALPLVVALGMDKALENKLIKAGKPYDLSYTLRAIVEVESSGGKYKINLQDPSCGVTMIHLKFFLKRHNIRPTNFNLNKGCQVLVDNDELAIAEAVDILMFWKDKFCYKWGCTSKQWDKVWAAYNGGYNYNSKKAREYAKKIRKTILKIKKQETVK